MVCRVLLRHLCATQVRLCVERSIVVVVCVDLRMQDERDRNPQVLRKQTEVLGEHDREKERERKRERALVVRREREREGEREGGEESRQRGM